MKKNCFVFVIIMFSLLSFSASDKIVWHYSLKEGLHIAQKKGLAVLIDFNASWCGPCKLMDRDVWMDKEMIKTSKNIVCISLDIDRKRADSGRYQIKSIPAMVFTDPYGNEITRRVGYHDAHKLINIINALPKNYSQINKYIEKLAQNKNDFDAIYNVAMFYKKSKMYDVSNIYFLKLEKNKKFKKDYNKYGEILLNLSFNNHLMGNYKESGKLFKKILKNKNLKKAHEMAYYGIIVSYISKKENKMAKQFYNDFKKEYPSSKAILKLKKYF